MPHQHRDLSAEMLFVEAEGLFAVAAIVEVYVQFHRCSHSSCSLDRRAQHKSSQVIQVRDDDIGRRSGMLAAIRQDTEALGFTMMSEPRTGALLATLAASKPGGRMLELGTGTGLGTA
jgi:hypothetical protein